MTVFLIFLLKIDKNKLDQCLTISSGIWFMIGLIMTTYSWFFILPFEFHHYHTIVKPLNLLMEGFFIISLFELIKTVKGKTKNNFLIYCLIITDFFILATLDFFLQETLYQFIALTEYCLVSGFLLILAIMSIRLNKTNYKRNPCMILSVFTITVFILYSKVLFFPSSFDEPYTILVFRILWSLTFTCLAVSRHFLIIALKRAKQTSHSKLEIFGQNHQLSLREIELCNLIVQGFSNKLIASELGIKESTVKKHFTCVYKKCGIASRLELPREISSENHELY